MQYSINRILGKKKGYGGRYVEIDQTNLTFKTLYQDYLDVYLEVSHPTYTEIKHVSLDDIQGRILNSDMSPNEWLGTIGNESLPSKSGKLEIKTSHVKHVDAFMAGFSIERTNMGYHPNNEFPTKDCKDLLLMKDGVDYYRMQKHCIVTVNGLIQQTSASEYGLYIVDGAYGQDHANETHIAITSFEDIGEIEIVNVTEDDVYRPNDNNKLYQHTYLNLNTSTEDRAVMMVMGGYLHVFDDSYLSIGDGLVRINFNNYPIIQRYYESMDYIDLSTLEYTPFDHNESQRSVKELLESDTWIKSMLNLKQTFFIVVNSPNVFIERLQLEKSGLLGTFYSDRRPTLPLTTQRGKLKEYWAYEDGGRWVLNCQSNLVPNYQFEHTSYRKLDNVTSQKTPMAPYYSDRGFLLCIGCDYLNTK